jgi:hypothetical protein
MILAVDVIGDRATQCDEFRARHHGQEPPSRYAETQQRVKSQTSFGPHDSSGPVRTDETIEAAGSQQTAAAVQTNVAVRAAGPKAQHRTNFQRSLRMVQEGRLNYLVLIG